MNNPKNNRNRNHNNVYELITIVDCERLNQNNKKQKQHKNSSFFFGFECACV